MVESIIRGKPEEEKLPAVVYLDDIAVFGDTVEEVLKATAEVMKRLAEAGFMINLKKSHLVKEKGKVLGHNWESGGYWMPVIFKLEALVEMSNEQLGSMNWASLYGLLNFYRDYVP